MSIRNATEEKKNIKRLRVEVASGCSLGSLRGYSRCASSGTSATSCSVSASCTYDVRKLTVYDKDEYSLIGAEVAAAGRAKAVG